MVDVAMKYKKDKKALANYLEIGSVDSLRTYLQSITFDNCFFLLNDLVKITDRSKDTKITNSGIDYRLITLKTSLYRMNNDKKYIDIFGLIRYSVWNKDILEAVKGMNIPAPDFSKYSSVETRKEGDENTISAKQWKDCMYLSEIEDFYNSNKLYVTMQMIMAPSVRKVQTFNLQDTYSNKVEASEIATAKTEKKLEVLPMVDTTSEIPVEHKKDNSVEIEIMVDDKTFKLKLNSETGEFTGNIYGVKVNIKLNEK